MGSARTLAPSPSPSATVRRVRAPGGRIVLVGQDWDTVVIDSDTPDLTHALTQSRTDVPGDGDGDGDCDCDGDHALTRTTAP
ncbi:hypothetical protein ABZX40_29410 [Streptomyces sp. NPDC004610]|uniref:hypothetical protein n=1 Tax=unclassified Streptomyces TaxID=2593676 RepID=UPI00339E59F1